MTDFVLKNVRLGYGPNLFVPQHFKNDPTTSKRFDAPLLIEHDDPQNAAIVAQIEQVAADAWGAKAKTVLALCRSDKQKYCYADGDLKVNSEGDAVESMGGYFILSAHRSIKNGPPRILDATGRDTTDAEMFYGGCYVNARVEIWAQVKGTGSPGIRASFGIVQFVADGDRIGGGGVSRSNLEGFDVIETDENSAAGLV